MCSPAAFSAPTPQASTGFLEQLLHIVRQGLGTAAVAVVHAQATLGVVDVAAGRVVHGVACGGLALGLLVIDLELLGQGRSLFGVADQGQEAGVEVGHVGLEHLGRVALGIHGDEDGLQAFAIGTEHLLDFGHLLHGGGAHIGALGVAKEHHDDLALEVLDAPLLAVVVLERCEVARIVHLRQIHAAKLRLAFGTSRKNGSSAYKKSASSYRFYSISTGHERGSHCR